MKQIVYVEWLTARNLPAFPLVPVSQSQAVVGAIIGIGLAKGGKNRNFKELVRIASGGILTPSISMFISLLGFIYFVKYIFTNSNK